MSTNKRIPIWMILVVRIAAVYHFLIGFFIVFFPKTIFLWLQIEPPNYLFIWQSLGVIVSVYGVAYYLCSYNLLKHYPIILIGLLSNFGITIAFIVSFIAGHVNASFFWIIFTNDMIWFVPYAFIWAYLFKEFQNTSMYLDLKKEEALHNFFLHDTGESIQEISEQQPVLMIFLRHFGCSFCRELMQELSENRMQLWQKNYKAIIVHMSSDKEALDFLKQYNLEDFSQISDPTCALYESFGIKRATYGEAFHFKSWWKAFLLMSKGVFVGELSGDGFRKAATAVIYKGELLKFSQRQYVFQQPELA
jgi:peroxiredoxin